MDALIWAGAIGLVVAFAITFATLFASGEEEEDDGRHDKPPDGG